MKRLSITLALLGLAGALALAAHFGLDSVARAIGRIGPIEFLGLIAWQLCLFVILGLSWHVVAPRDGGRPAWVLVWARMVRDASATCLPFSQLGGFVFGTRAATLHGVAWPRATASLVVDVTAEFLAQIVFAAIGLTILLAHLPRTDLALPVAIGIGLALAGALALVLAQKGAGAVFVAMGRRIAGNRLGAAADRMDELRAELAAIHADVPRLVMAFGLHLTAWLGTGVAGWLVLRMLDVPLGLDQAIAIEALLAAVAAMAFLVPVNAGVQEAGYVGLGALFGVPPEVALAASLVRRARDVAIGLPILLVWQGVEVRRLRRRPQE